MSIESIPSIIIYAEISRCVMRTLFCRFNGISTYLFSNNQLILFSKSMQYIFDCKAKKNFYCKTLIFDIV